MRNKRLRTLLPFGRLTTRQALREGGFSTHQIDNLLKSETLVAESPGVYRMPETPVTWEGMVASLQQLGSNVTVGGYTALQMAGFEHNLSLSAYEKVTLFSGRPLPRWSLNLLSNVTIEQTRHSRLIRERPTELWRPLATVRQPDTALQTSQPELAWLEALLGVPDRLSFEHADHLSESLATLSPKRLQQALHLCHNIKVKRLFFWFAARHQHVWSKRLTHSDFNLGSGKRVIANPGKLDKDFLITVPESLYGPT